MDSPISRPSKFILHRCVRPVRSSGNARCFSQCRVGRKCALRQVRRCCCCFPCRSKRFRAHRSVSIEALVFLASVFPVAYAALVSSPRSYYSPGESAAGQINAESEKRRVVLAHMIHRAWIFGNTCFLSTPCTSARPRARHPCCFAFFPMCMRMMLLTLYLCSEASPGSSAINRTTDHIVVDKRDTSVRKVHACPSHTNGGSRPTFTSLTCDERAQ